jgi:Cd2+-exporting ATPase
MVALDKQTVRVTYDARVIGTRDLLKRAFEFTVTLVLLGLNAELESGGKHVRKTACMTAFSAVLTVPVLVLAWAPLPQHKILYGTISLALATAVQIVASADVDMDYLFVYHNY